MCIECRQTPCHPRCPNADPPKPVFLCGWCNAEIYESDDYFEIDDCQVCESCISDCSKTAEREDYYNE